MFDVSEADGVSVPFNGRLVECLASLFVLGNKCRTNQEACHLTCPLLLRTASVFEPDQ